MKITNFSLQEIEDTEEVLFKKHQLENVRKFLVDSGAGDDLIYAVEIAIEDLDRYLIEDLAILIKAGKLIGGTA